jgi:GNAT superfamily N-acetyltransferase
VSGMDSPTVRVRYLELLQPPAAVADRGNGECIVLERLTRTDYLALYRRVGEPVRWDQRLQLPAAQLDALLSSEALRLYVLRSASGQAIGLCEFDRSGFPDIELKNFGIAPEMWGHGLGRWLLGVALRCEWESEPSRIWLHTDNWDHPAALHLYEWAGFRVYAERDEDPGPL